MYSHNDPDKKQDCGKKTRKALKSAIKGIAFFLCLLLCLGTINNVLRLKSGDGIEGPQVFRQLPENSVDALFVGSSRIFENVNTATLWNEFGIAGFDLAGSVQPFWNTYHYLIEALETQTPRVIVLECFRALEVNDFSDNSRIAKNTFGLSLSANSLDNKLVSSPEDELFDYLAEFPIYHNRYVELKREDFLPNKGIPNRDSWKGHGVNNTVGQLSAMPDVSGVTERSALSDKTMGYLEKITALCKDRDIPLVLIVAPSNVTASDQSVYNSVADYAAEQGLPFLNFNLMYEEIGLDFVSSNSDLAADGHLNHRGSVKFTNYLGAWLKDHYDLPDRRDDGAKWASWEIDAQTTESCVQDAEIRNTAVLAEWLSLAREGLSGGSSSQNLGNGDIAASKTEEADAYNTVESQDGLNAEGDSGTGIETGSRSESEGRTVTDRLVVALTVQGNALKDPSVSALLSSMFAEVDASSSDADDSISANSSGSSYLTTFADVFYVLDRGSVSALSLSAGTEGEQLVFPLWDRTLMITSNGDGTASVQLGVARYSLPANGVFALVYDQLTGSLVECVQWNAGSYSEKVDATVLNPAV